MGKGRIGKSRKVHNRSTPNVSPLKLYHTSRRINEKEGEIRISQDLFIEQRALK